MKYKAMGFDIRDNVAWITFNRPDAMNAICLVASQPLGPLAWPPNWLRYANAIKNRFNLGGFMLLSGCYFDSEGHS